MSNIIIFVIIWILVLGIDLIAIGARISFLQMSHARLLAQRETAGHKINETLKLLPELSRIRASLSLLLIFTRFSLAGLALYLLSLKTLALPFYLIIAVFLIIALVCFWLEWLVERLILRSAEAWALRTTNFVRAWLTLMGVLLFPLSLASDSQSSAEMQVTQDELKTLVDAGQEEGVFEQEERRMIYSIFELRDTLAREIMIPRTDMQALDVKTAINDAVDAMLASGHSRVPVYEDYVDNTLGLLYAKDLLRAVREDSGAESLRSLLRPAYFVPEAKKVDELFAEMQSKRVHMAIVVDEYGGVAGLVTLEDIVEEILGEIQDEYDDAEEAPYQEQPDGSYLFLGRIDLDDFNEIIGAGLSSEEADSLGGYIYHQLGHVPSVGEEVRSGELILTVEQVTGRRIKKVGARWSQPSQTEDDHDN